MWGGHGESFVRDMLHLQCQTSKWRGSTNSWMYWARVGKNICPEAVNLGIIRVWEVVQATGQNEVTLETYREKKTT